MSEIDTIVENGRPRAKLTWLACRIERFLQEDARAARWEVDRYLESIRAIEQSRHTPLIYRAKRVLNRSDYLRSLVDQFVELTEKNPGIEVDESVLIHNQKMIDGDLRMQEHARLRGSINRDYHQGTLRDLLLIREHDTRVLSGLFRHFGP